MRAVRILITAMFAMALVPFAAGAAMAAPPGNDEAPGAVVVHLGDRVEQDTTEATTNAGDDALNANCGAPATNASVWYQYTPSVKHNVVLDTSESSYSAGLMVFDGTPTADSLISCGPGAVGIVARAGHTYTIMAFSDTDVIGGALVLTLQNAPTPTVHLAVAKHGVAFHGGAARIHGTYKCRHGEGFAAVEAHLLQRAGRLKIQADSGKIIQCDGARHPWSVRLVSEVGTYARGAAVAKVNIIACGLINCRQDRVKRHVHLAWASSPNRQWMKHPTTGRTEPARPLLSRQHHWPSS
jgi:hypothetical protein